MLSLQMLHFLHIMFFALIKDWSHDSIYHKVQMTGYIKVGSANPTPMDQRVNLGEG